MATKPDPVVLELASLPREQAGPFLLLGLDKTADREAIEAHWAERVKWARKGLVKVPLEDVNWAREALADVHRRVRADAASLNLDLTDGLLARLSYRYGAAGGGPGRGWRPRDDEKPLADYAPPAEVPDFREVAAALAVPEVPDDLPGAALLLGRLAAAPLDPWAVELPADETAAPGPGARAEDRPS